MIGWRHLIPISQTPDLEHQVSQAGAERRAQGAEEAGLRAGSVDGSVGDGLAVILQVNKQQVNKYWKQFSSCCCEEKKAMLLGVELAIKNTSNARLS
jgi:hypothetical protein